MRFFVNPNPTKALLTSVSVVLIAFQVACGSEAAGDDKAAPIEAAPKAAAAEDAKQSAMKAEDLTTAYVTDAAKAEQDYKGKSIVVTGKITQIDTDVNDKTFVALAGHREANGVKCIVEENAIANLKVGMTVTVKGTVNDFYLVVTMDDCEVLSSSN